MLMVSKYSRVLVKNQHKTIDTGKHDFITIEKIFYENIQKASLVG